MFRTHFPDLTWLKQVASSRFSAGKDDRGLPIPSKGWPNVVLNVNSPPTERENVPGPFSLFMNLKGNSMVRTEGSFLKLGVDFFCISNDRQEYDLIIPNGQMATTFNIHFSDRLFNEVAALQGNTGHLSSLMGMYEDPLSKWIHFSSFTHWKDSFIMQIIAKIQQEGSQMSDDREIELLGELLSHILKRLNGESLQIQRISALKKNTRLEIISRINKAKDIIHGTEGITFDLEALSREVGMSRFHLLRVFREVTGFSPERYATHIRMQRAKRFLSLGMDIQEVAVQLGFSEHSSFSRAFLRNIGHSPSHFQKNAMDSSLKLAI